MLKRLALLSLFLVLSVLPIACYPPYQPPLVPAAAVAVPSVPVITPPVQSTQAAVAIEKKATDAELKLQEIALQIYEKVVTTTRQGKVKTADYTAIQRAYDDLQAQLHAASVLKPLGNKPAEDARLSVAKALWTFLSLAQKAGAF